MSGTTDLRCAGDAAFKKEEDEGHSLRGALFLRCSTSGSNPADASNITTRYVSGGNLADANKSIFNQSCIVHIVDTICKSQRHVTRLANY
eukprot:12683405-Heterocapsa_arctica.AAC.1